MIILLYIYITLYNDENKNGTVYFIKVRLYAWLKGKKLPVLKPGKCVTLTNLLKLAKY